MFAELNLQENQVLIVGVYSYTSNGKSGSVVSYLRDFDGWQRERGTVVEGVCAESEFTHMDCLGLQVGDVVQLIYQKGFKGKAELVGYSVVRQAVVE